jgi:hypothetical protein
LICTAGVEGPSAKVQSKLPPEAIVETLLTVLSVPQLGNPLAAENVS